MVRIDVAAVIQGWHLLFSCLNDLYPLFKHSDYYRHEVFYHKIQHSYIHICMLYLRG